MQSTFTVSRGIQSEASETAQKTGHGYYLRSTPTNMGFNPVAASITLTDQYLLIAPERQGSSPVGLSLTAMGVLKPTVFPLSHIRTVAIYPKTVWGKRDVLQIEFDNDGHEYLWVQPAETWQAAIMAARASAPDLPFSTLPTVKNGVEASSSKTVGKVLLVVMGIMVALLLTCIVAGIIVGMMR